MIGKTMLAAAALMLAVPAVAEAGGRSWGWQGQHGRGGTGSVSRSYDPATGTVYRDRTYTSNSGRSWSSQSAAGCANGSCGRDTTYTGPRGTSTRSAGWARDGQGGATGSVTWTGPRGGSTTIDRWIRVDQ